MDQRETDGFNKEAFLALHEATDHLIHLPDFGLWHLTIPEAAELVALDMWYSGELPEIEEPEDWDGTEDDPKLKALLTPVAKDFESRLIVAVEKGTLKPVRERRDFDERLVPDHTFINDSHLTSWLEERGYNPGDTFNSRSYDEATIYELVCREVVYLRAESRRGSGALRQIELQRSRAFLGSHDPKTADEVLAAYKALVLENQQLKERLTHHEEQPPTPVTRPVSTKQRDTFQVIIEALCRELGIDTQARGASQRIREITERSPVTVDDGTIKPILDAIPDSLQRRQKK